MKGSNTAALLLTEAEQEKIKKAVREVEQATSGEIVPMIVSASYSYPRADLIGGFVFGLIAAIGIALVLRATDMWTFLAVFAVTFMLGYQIVTRVASLKRLFVPGDEMDEEVEEAAMTSFFTNDLHHTRDRTGILFYISLFEHRVRVLADQGINAKVDPAVWQEVVEMIVGGIKSGNPADAICEAVLRCGELVKEHFPVRQDDTNELRNLIIQEGPGAAK